MSSTNSLSDREAEKNFSFFQQLISSPCGQDNAYSISFHPVETENWLSKVSQSRGQEEQKGVFFPVDAMGNEDIKEIYRQTGLRMNINGPISFYSTRAIAGDNDSVFLIYDISGEGVSEMSKFLVKREKIGRRIVRSTLLYSSCFLCYNQSKDKLFVFSEGLCLVFDGQTLKQIQRKILPARVISVSMDESGNFSLVCQLGHFHDIKFCLLDEDLETLVEDVTICKDNHFVDSATRHPSGYHLIVFHHEKGKICLYRPDFSLAHVVSPGMETERLVAESCTGRVLAEMVDEKGRSFWAEVKIEPKDSNTKEDYDCDCDCKQSPEDLWLVEACGPEEKAIDSLTSAKKGKFFGQGSKWILGIAAALFASYWMRKLL